MKTARQWLEELPSPQKEKTINYSKSYKGEGILNCETNEGKQLHDVLFSAFVFVSTEEGHVYWMDFYNKLKQDYETRSSL